MGLPEGKNDWTADLIAAKKGDDEALERLDLDTQAEVLEMRSETDRTHLALKTADIQMQILAAQRRENDVAFEQRLKIAMLTRLSKEGKLEQA